MNASTGLELAICLLISRLVLRGFVVVIMAPSDITERQTMGKKMELGESNKTTSPLRIPKSASDDETDSTALHTSENVRRRPVDASM